MVSQFLLNINNFSPVLNINQGILIFPVIERFQYIMTIILIAIINNQLRLRNISAIFYRVLFFIIISFAIISGILWRFSGSYIFNLSALDVIWELLAMIIVLINMGLIINDQGRPWKFGFLLFTILLFGLISHFFINTSNYYSGPMRASQLVVFSLFPFFLNHLFQLQKYDSFNHSDLLISKEKFKIGSVKDVYNVADSNLALIWMELLAYSSKIDPIPRLLRAISFSFHQDFILYFINHDHTNRIIFQTGFDNKKKAIISSEKIQIPDYAGLETILEDSDSHLISRNDADYNLFFDKFSEILSDDNINEMVIVPLAYEKKCFGILIFISPINKILWHSDRINLFVKLADLSSNIIFSFQKYNQPLVNLPSEHIDQNDVNEENLTNSDNKKLNIENNSQTNEVVNKSSRFQVIKEKEQITLIVQELRQPLSSILGYTDLILSESSGGIGALQQKFLMKIKDGNERMRSLLDELIQITSFGELQSNFNYESLSIEEIIDKAIYLNHELLLNKKIALRLSFDKEIPQLTADREAIQLAMNNLINSVINSSLEGGEINIIIIIKASEFDEKYLLTIMRNSGISSKETQINDVFSNNRLDTTPLSKFNNDLEVNLAFTKTLVEAHGGRIWIETVKGNRKQYSFLLPIINQVIHA